MAMYVCKYVFDKHVIGQGQARIQVFIIEGRPVLARVWWGGGARGMSPPEAPAN